MKTAHVILYLICFLPVALIGGEEAALEKTLKSSIVKELEFEEVSVDAAFKRMSEISRGFTQNKRRINIYIIAPKDVKNKKITLSMKDSSLFDIIKYMALLSGLNMKIEKHAVVLKAGKK